MPVQHGALLIAVPALGMQFANDCIWIGDEVGRRWDKAANGKARPADEQEVTRSTERMRQLGAEWRAKLVVSISFVIPAYLFTTSTLTIFTSAVCTEGCFDGELR